ncbi:hypothetical protein CYY_001657 [Polysphondylium violaceum]|uniref:MPN domain-containing protein n=1 Tax=Polysphondylium violaceum TaxID=133409 RepID=A0A8J4V1G0_9MYCE|nr:hypothetical protein CYY_001657 [Polysphondylium violaceum]
MGNEKPLYLANTFQELVDNNVNKIEVDKNYKIFLYLSTLNNLIKQADIYKSEGDMEMAFVFLFRFVLLTLEKLPKHPEYSDSKFAKSRDTLKNEAKAKINELENIKSNLLNRYQNLAKEKEKQLQIRLEREERERQENEKRLKEIREKQEQDRIQQQEIDQQLEWEREIKKIQDEKEERENFLKRKQKIERNIRQAQFQQQSKQLRLEALREQRLAEEQDRIQQQKLKDEEIRLQNEIIQQEQQQKQYEQELLKQQQDEENRIDLLNNNNNDILDNTSSNVVENNNNNVEIIDSYSSNNSKIIENNINQEFENTSISFDTDELVKYLEKDKSSSSSSKQDENNNLDYLIDPSFVSTEITSTKPSLKLPPLPLNSTDTNQSLEYPSLNNSNNSNNSFLQQYQYQQQQQQQQKVQSPPQYKTYTPQYQQHRVPPQPHIPYQQQQQQHQHFQQKTTTYAPQFYPNQQYLQQQQYYSPPISSSAISQQNVKATSYYSQIQHPSIPNHNNQTTTQNLYQRQSLLQNGAPNQQQSYLNQQQNISASKLTNVQNPTLASKSNLNSTEASKKLSKLRKIIVNDGLFDEFMKLAHQNTRNQIETCGILSGTLSNDVFKVTTLIIPKQEGTSDTCNTIEEHEIFEYQLEHDLLTLGWIHTHPTQDCFLSAVDVHTHCSYQYLLPEAIAVVMSPSVVPDRGIFRLTDPPGMETVQKCKLKSFHPHPPVNGVPIYRMAEHVQVNRGKGDSKVIDLRTLKK